MMLDLAFDRLTLFVFSGFKSYDFISAHNVYPLKRAP
jgi:hypothetical protein